MLLVLMHCSCWSLELWCTYCYGSPFPIASIIWKCEENSPGRFCLFEPSKLLYHTTSTVVFDLIMPIFSLFLLTVFNHLRLEQLNHFAFIIEVITHFVPEYHRNGAATSKCNALHDAYRSIKLWIGRTQCKLACTQKGNIQHANGTLH